MQQTTLPFPSYSDPQSSLHLIISSSNKRDLILETFKVRYWCKVSRFVKKNAFELSTNYHWVTRPKNFIETDTETFFGDQNFRDRDWDFFLRPNIFETDTETFFRDQMFSRPIPRLFFETKCFQDQYRDFFETKFFRDWYRDFCKS